MPRLTVSTALASGVQTVRIDGIAGPPLPSPCCGGEMRRVLDDPRGHEFLAMGRPTIGSAAHPFICLGCGAGYTVKPVGDVAGNRFVQPVSAATLTGRF